MRLLTLCRKKLQRCSSQPKRASECVTVLAAMIMVAAYLGAVEERPGMAHVICGGFVFITCTCVGGCSRAESGTRPAYGQQQGP
jgi:hypothetical protein